MGSAIFLLLVGSLLRAGSRWAEPLQHRPARVVALTLLAAIGCPVLTGGLALAAGLPVKWTLALVLAVAAPPSAGTAALAWMLGLDGAMALTITLAATAVAPLTVTAFAALQGGIAIYPLPLAGRLLLLVSGAAMIALLLRRYAGALLIRHHAVVDALLLGSLILFALSAMAGVRAQIVAQPGSVMMAVALAYAAHLAQLSLGAMLPGDLPQRATAGVILGNRNVGLVWSALGTAVTPGMALYFAATQLPIYTLPLLWQAVLPRLRARFPAQTDEAPPCRTACPPRPPVVG